MKRLCELLIVLLCGTGFALAQTTMGQPQQSTPPTFPSQQQPGMQHKPDESGPLGQVGASSTTTLAKAESNIKSVLRQQMPTVANRVVVSETEDQKIKLSGTVNTDTAKQQVEQLARTVAPQTRRSSTTWTWPSRLWDQLCQAPRDLKVHRTLSRIRNPGNNRPINQCGRPKTGSSRETAS